MTPHQKYKYINTQPPNHHKQLSMNRRLSETHPSIPATFSHVRCSIPSIDLQSDQRDFFWRVIIESTTTRAKTTEATVESTMEAVKRSQNLLVTVQILPQPRRLLPFWAKISIAAAEAFPVKRRMMKMRSAMERRRSMEALLWFVKETPTETAEYRQATTFTMMKYL